MHVSDEQLGVIGRHAKRIEGHASRVAEAHSLGHGPGEHTDICSVRFQRRAREVHKETLPPAHQRLVADSFEHCAWLMGAMRPDGAVAEDWETLAAYLRAVAEAIAEDPDCPARRASFEALDIGGYPPEVVHYENLARLMPPGPVERLSAAAAAVAQYCRFGSPMAPAGIQLVCLQGLVAGEKHADIAKRLGYSERHLQRLLAGMWDQFGVDNTVQGVAFAAAHGWITVRQDTV